MSELQDTLNKIISDPEAVSRLQSLGKQLGLGSGAASAPVSAPQSTSDAGMMSALGKLAPLMSAARPDDETTALLNALRPFLSAEKLERLNSAQRLISLIRVIPLLKDSGLFL